MSNNSKSLTEVLSRCQGILKSALLPSGVTKNYLRYMKWRLIQRFCKSVLHVLGTTSLLMGLGISTSRKQLTTATTTHWIVKDFLGKVVRVGWASLMGRSFDADAKRWRFRSSLIFMVGSALEMMCRVFPAYFLLLASFAKACQQISMLTTSSTRTVFYQALSESSNNMGDITAKGEAQIAIVSLLGMFTGIGVCRTIGSNLEAVLVVYTALQILELVSAYRQLRAVSFNALNLERLQIVTEEFLMGKEVPTPNMVASRERIFLPAPRINFSTLDGSTIDPESLISQLHSFKNENFAIVDHESPRILLRREASGVDLAKSILAYTMASQGIGPSQALKQTETLFPLFLSTMEKAGWQSPSSFIGTSGFLRTDWKITADG